MTLTLSGRIFDRPGVPASELPIDLNGLADAATAGIAAIGKPWLVPANSTAILNVGPGQAVTTASVALDAIARWVIPSSSTVTLQLASGKTINPTLVWSHPYGDRITIAGQQSTTLTPTVFIGATGAANNWQTTIDFGTATAAAVGDYLLSYATAGTGHHEVLRGVYPVTAVNGSQITLRNTGWYTSFPTLTLSGGSFVLIKTVLRFENVDGLVVRGSRIGAVRNIVFEGNADDYWSAADVTGTEKGTQGIVVGSPTLFSANPASLLKQNGNILGSGTSSISLDRYVGVFGFDQQGILAGNSSSIFANFSASSNNRRRGYYGDGSSLIWAKGLSAGGNYLDGVIGDNASNIIASSNSAAVGNGGRGVFGQSGSVVDFSTGILKGNLGGGALVQNGGAVQTSSAVYSPAGVVTGTVGVTTQNGGTFVLDGATIDGFATGVLATNGGNVRALTALTVTNCTTAGVRSEAGSGINLAALTASGNAADTFNRDLSTLVINGVPVPPNWTATGGFAALKAINGAATATWLVTSAGDLNLTIGSTSLWTVKSGSGVMFPATATATIGRTDANLANLYTKKITLGADTAPQILTGAGAPNGSVAAPAGSIYFSSNAGAGTTLYVKEGGADNTGWVSK